MEKYFPYAALLGIASIIAYFYYMPAAYVLGGICAVYFFVYFVILKD